MSDQRKPPGIPVLLNVLRHHDVAFVLVGSVAIQAWGVDVGTPGDLDIVPETSPANLERLSEALRDIDAVSWPVTGRWMEQNDEFRWESFPEDHPLYGQRITDPDPSDVTTFDSLFATRHGELDIVPLIAGTYNDLAPRASRLTVQGVPDVLVSSVEDLLARLIVPRRAKDAGRVRSLRHIQRTQ
ncbi:MAG TPA: hypothetical protein VKZ61_15980 [Thermomicrobiales bacterium]|nr:hypothetical protein [Thermomicrobiales bacterium]